MPDRTPKREEPDGFNVVLAVAAATLFAIIALAVVLPRGPIDHQPMAAGGSSHAAAAEANGGSGAIGPQ